MNYIVDSTDLTSVANAIRTKGGTSASLAFPADFVSAIQAIPTGGGADYLEIFLDFLSGTANTDPLSLPGLQKIDGRNKCTNIKFPSIIFPDLTSSLPDFCFQGASVPILVFPSLTGRIGSNAFRSTGAGISTIDFGPGATETGSYTFNDCRALSTIIFRRDGVVSLANTGNTVPGPFASNGSGGTLYVPSAQVSQYTQASNWSTILGYPNNQIKSIESTHTDPNAPIDLTLYYADGTPIA